MNNDNTSGLYQNIINALEDMFISIDLDTEANVIWEDEECVTVSKNNTKRAKTNKTIIHPSAVLDMIEVGIRKMKNIKLLVVRHHRS